MSSSGAASRTTPLLVRLRDHQRPLAVGQQLLQHHHVAHDLEVADLDHVQRLVQHQLLAEPEVVQIDRRAGCHPELAAPGEHVQRVVVVAAEEGAESGRRLGQPVDFLLQGDDLLSRLPQRVGQPLVLSGDTRQGGLCFGQPALEPPTVCGVLQQPTPQRCDFGFQVPDLVTQLCRGRTLVSSHDHHLTMWGSTLWTLPRKPRRAS